MRILGWICLMLIVASACSSTPESEGGSTGSPTSLPRFFEGERVTLEELSAAREQAISCAHALMLLDRELQEPWIESRTALALIGQLRQREPVPFQLAEAAWLGTEPCAAGDDRRLFAECGIYRPHRKQGESWLRTNPGSLEAHGAVLLQAARTDSANGRLLSAWRRLAPAVSRRRSSYLASVWEFTIGGQSRVELRDSLLGPFTRCAAMVGDNSSVSGPLADAGGFEVPAALLHELLPGPGLPLDALVRQLSGGGVQAGFELSVGPQARGGEPTLVATLPALADGMCGIEYVPAGAVSVRVTVSYLQDRSDGRAELVLRRQGFSSWILESLFVEPPAPSPDDRRGARQDLMPLLRARHGA